MSLATPVRPGLLLAGAGRHRRLRRVHRLSQGKVYLKEKLVNGGDIAFVAANKKVSTTQIKADGSYELPAVPTGLAKISVSTPTEVKVPGGMTMKPGAMGAPEKSAEADTPKGKTVAIPEKYRDAEKSGLEFTVKTGQQEYDIKLP